MKLCREVDPGIETQNQTPPESRDDVLAFERKNPVTSGKNVRSGHGYFGLGKFMPQAEHGLAEHNDW